MKKRMKVISSALLIILVLAFLSGCGKSYAGIWCCAYMDTGDTVMTAGDLDNVGSNLYIDLRSGGVGYMTADNEIQKISWTQRKDGTALMLQVNGQLERFEIQGDALVWDMNGTTVTFLPKNSTAYQEALSSFSLVNWLESEAAE
jgi:hypothetical protein